MNMVYCKSPTDLPPWGFANETANYLGRLVTFWSQWSRKYLFFFTSLQAPIPHGRDAGSNPTPATPNWRLRHCLGRFFMWLISPFLRSIKSSEWWIIWLLSRWCSKMIRLKGSLRKNYFCCDLANKLWNSVTILLPSIQILVWPDLPEKINNIQT